jgi:hypothetical protein
MVIESSFRSNGLSQCLLLWLLTTIYSNQLKGCIQKSYGEQEEEKKDE